MTDDTQAPPECEIVDCTAPANRELHIPKLDTWKAYCKDHTPRVGHDDERFLD